MKKLLALTLLLALPRLNLHSFWDGLLGTGTTTGAIGSAVREIEEVLKARVFRAVARRA